MELTPERQAIAEQYRQKISQYIAGQLTPQVVDRPMFDIGFEDEYVS